MNRLSYIAIFECLTRLMKSMRPIVSDRAEKGRLGYRQGRRVPYYSVKMFQNCPNPKPFYQHHEVLTSQIVIFKSRMLPINRCGGTIDEVRCSVNKCEICARADRQLLRLRPDLFRARRIHKTMRLRTQSGAKAGAIVSDTARSFLQSDCIARGQL